MCCFILTTSGGEVWVIILFLQWFYQSWLIYYAWTWWRWFLEEVYFKDTCPYYQICHNCPVILFKAFFSALFWQYCKFFLFLNLIYFPLYPGPSLFHFLSFYLCTKYCALGLVRPYMLFIDIFRIVVPWIDRFVMSDKRISPLIRDNSFLSIWTWQSSALLGLLLTQSTC